MKKNFTKFLNLSALALITSLPLTVSATNIVITNIINENGITNEIRVDGNNISYQSDYDPEQTKYDNEQLDFLKTLRNLFYPFEYISLSNSLKHAILSDIDTYVEQNTDEEYNTIDKSAYQTALNDKQDPNYISSSNIVSRLFLAKMAMTQNCHTLIDKTKNKELMAVLDKEITKYTKIYLKQIYEKNDITNITAKELTLNKEVPFLTFSDKKITLEESKEYVAYLKNIRKTYEPYNYSGLSENTITAINSDIHTFSKKINEPIYSLEDIEYRNNVLNNKNIIKKERLEQLELIQTLSKHYTLHYGYFEGYELNSMINLRTYRLENNIKDLDENNIFSQLTNEQYYETIQESLIQSSMPILATDIVDKKTIEMNTQENNTPDWQIILLAFLATSSTFLGAFIFNQHRKVKKLEHKVNYYEAVCDPELEILDQKIKVKI